MVQIMHKEKVPEDLPNCAVAAHESSPLLATAILEVDHTRLLYCARMATSCDKPRSFP